MKRNQFLRTGLMFLGVLIIGTAVGLFRVASLGTDPLATLAVGLSVVSGIQFGTTLLGTNIFLLIFAWFAGRKYIGLGTFANMVLVGYTADFIVSLAETPVTFLNQVVLVLFSVFVLSVGASLAMSADMGIAPYDVLPLLIVKASKNRLSFRAAKIALDVAAVTLGFLLGATVGIGTLAATFLVGPLMQVFNVHLINWIDRQERKRTSA